MRRTFPRLVSEGELDNLIYDADHMSSAYASTSGRCLAPVNMSNPSDYLELDPDMPLLYPDDTGASIYFWGRFLVWRILFKIVRTGVDVGEFLRERRAFFYSGSHGYTLSLTLKLLPQTTLRTARVAGRPGLYESKIELGILA